MFSTTRSWLSPFVALLAAGCTGDPPAAITSRTDLTNPASSLIYTQATTLHGGDKSVQIE